jgi:hypothetical protein
MSNKKVSTKKQENVEKERVPKLNSMFDQIFYFFSPFPIILLLICFNCWRRFFTQNLFFFFSTVLFFYFHLDAKWKQQGITVAGGNGKGKQLNQLSYPYDICIDDDDTIFIADFENDRILG